MFCFADLNDSLITEVFAHKITKENIIRQKRGFSSRFNFSTNIDLIFIFYHVLTELLLKHFLCSLLIFSFQYFLESILHFALIVTHSTFSCPEVTERLFTFNKPAALFQYVWPFWYPPGIKGFLVSLSIKGLTWNESMF